MCSCNGYSITPYDFQQLFSTSYVLVMYIIASTAISHGQHGDMGFKVLSVAWEFLSCWGCSFVLSLCPRITVYSSQYGYDRLCIDAHSSNSE